MGKKPSPRVLLFIIFVFCTTGRLGALGLGVAGRGDLIVTSITGVPTKTQAGAGTSITVTFPFFDIAGPGFSILLSNIWPSDAGGWVIVRGYYEIGLSIFGLGQAMFLSLPDVGDFHAGGRAGISASIAGYQLTTLVFFMPGVELAGFVSWTPAGIPNWTFTASIPMRWLLRADVAFSGSVGLELGVSFSPGPPRETLGEEAEQ
jgi:hypothetical protein